MRIKSDLVYDKHTGELVGFVDLEWEMTSYTWKKSLKNEKSLAKNVLVIMVRGVGTNLKFPLAHFATNCVTSDQLFPILWKYVKYTHGNKLGSTCNNVTTNFRL